jgi:hypothetical protein
MVETGKCIASADVIKAYERVLGIGQLDDNVNRRDFLKAVSLVAGNTKVATELVSPLRH